MPGATRATSRPSRFKTFTCPFSAVTYTILLLSATFTRAIEDASAPRIIKVLVSTSKPLELCTSLIPFSNDTWLEKTVALEPAAKSSRVPLFI